MNPTLAFIALAFAGVVHAIDAPELDELRANYQAAMERANRPIMQAYLTQLERQRDAYSRATKLDAANATQAEINEIKQALAKLDAAKAIPPKSTPPAAVLNSKEQLFVNISWRTPRGSSFHFLPDGKGIRSVGAVQTSFVWHARGGVVEATGDSTTGGKKTTWFFRFASNSQAYYGDTRDGINLKLQKD